MTESFTERFAAGFAGYGTRPCIEFEHRWYSGDEIVDCSRRIADCLRVAGVPDDAAVGLVVRNRIPHAAAIMGFLAAGRPVAMIYSFQSAEAIARDVEKLDLAAVIADEEDWTPPVSAAAQRIGAAGVAISTRDLTVGLVDGLAHTDQDRQRSVIDAALAILTSGTTGPPKRFVVRAEVLEHTVFSVTGGVAAPDDPPELVYWPLGGIGGVCQLATGGFIGKPMVLLERFSVGEWVRAIKTHAIRRCGLQPAVVRMLLDADLPVADLASLEFVMSASGPLDAHTRDAFEARYGLPVLTAYGATEFAGSVCTWTPDLYREFGATKRASSGRPLPGVEVRILDGQTGAELPTGSQGILEAKIPLLGPEWVRTTDIASIDADDFITLHGRADGAINRGGFKILPETVRAVLVSHPAVRDACVVGVSDSRLGEVPFAVVEAMPGTAPAGGELTDLVREFLPKHNVPVAIAVVEELPRTPSMKVSLGAVRELYSGESTRR